MSTTLDFMHEIESQESLGNHNVKPVFFPSDIDVESDSYSEIVLCRSHPVSDGQAIPMLISKASPVTRREIKTEPSWKVRTLDNIFFDDEDDNDSENHIQPKRSRRGSENDVKLSTGKK